MRIIVLVKEVPDTNGDRALHLETGLVQRTESVLDEIGERAVELGIAWAAHEDGQVEEVATMSDLLAVVTRNADDIDDIEDYVAREQRSEGTDATAPRVAGV